VSLKFNRNYFKYFIALLIIETSIAIFISEGFIRSTFGDFLVVILVYCFVKSFLNKKSLPVAIGVLLFTFLIEFLQLFDILNLLRIENNKIVKTILGSSFHISDLIAYTLGTISILMVEYMFLRHEKYHSKPST